MIHQIEENSFRKIFGKTSEKGNHEDSFFKRYLEKHLKIGKDED